MLRSVARNNVVLLLQYAVGGLVPIVLIPHIVREIGVASFGTLAIALAWANYGSIVVQYAFNLTGPRQIAQLTPGQTEAAVFQQITTTKLALLSVLFPLAGTFLLSVSLLGASWSGAQLLILLALPLASALHSGWYLQASGRFAVSSTISMVGALCSLAFGFMLVSTNNTNVLVFAALSLVMGALISSVGTMLASTRILGFPAIRINRQHSLHELREGWPLFASQFTAALYGASGPIIVGWLVGVEQAGAYTAVERMISAVVSACMLTHTAAYPTLARLYQSDRRHYLRLLFGVIATYLAVAISIATTCYFFWDQVLNFIFGSNAGSFGVIFSAGLVWLTVGIFGTTFTGYLTVSGQGARVLPLTFKILMASFLIGVPGVIYFGAWAWLASLSIAQLIVIYSAAKAWRPYLKRA